MYEKILLKLQEQRRKTSNISERSLESLAKSMETLITTDELLEKFDFTSSLEAIDGNMIKATSDAFKKQGKSGTDSSQGKPDDQNKTEKPSDKGDVGKVSDPIPDPNMQKLFDAIGTLSSEITSLKQEKVGADRAGVLKKALEKTPEYYQTPILQSFASTQFETDEAFTKYVQAQESSATIFLQKAKENGLNHTTPSKGVVIPEDTGETVELSDALKLVTKEKEKENGNNN